LLLNNYTKTRSSADAERPRDALLVNSCAAARGMGVRNGSKIEYNLQGHSRALTMAALDRPHAISY